MPWINRIIAGWPCRVFKPETRIDSQLGKARETVSGPRTIQTDAPIKNEPINYNPPATGGEK